MDRLEAFCDWYLKNVPLLGTVPFGGAVRKIEDVYAVQLWRSPPFQVQMFIVPPNYIIPEHTHPNVDSIEVYIGGQIRFSHGGKFVVTEDQFNNPNEHGGPQLRGQRIRVRPSDVHGGVFGPNGGVFLSVQQWLNDVEPHCVSADYDGITMGKDHLAQVVFGEAWAKDKLTPKDAAGLEQ